MVRTKFLGHGRSVGYGTVILLGLAVAGGAHAVGDVCSNVDIKLTNSTGGEIKVTRFEYYDYADQRWRTEVMFGPDGHQKLEAGKSWSKVQDLEHVENDRTKFKVTYRSRIGGTKWDEPTTKVTGDFTCTDEMDKEVVLDVGVTPAALDVEGCTAQQAAEIAEVIDWGARNWDEYERVLEDIRDWPVNIGRCLEGRFKQDGRVVCEGTMQGFCTSRGGPNNGWASALNKRCHMCPGFLASLAAIPAKESRQACYFALVTHEWGHTCERGHKTLEIVDDEAFDFWKLRHAGVTIALADCGMR